ncbi:SHOCT domain-containing protein [Enterovibrio norvegicus]|uniref:SHOCT domain-containing protein n=1 Tax=Enterovibrio norvegicus TaxID=188144 RepID=UPI000C8280E1|nr:SHOCT domain-containing protein [Enterovibrio norvegicus]PMN70615.1 hypothetical protein BCT27_02565 [Enterovibrio norvegicus]
MKKLLILATIILSGCSQMSPIEKASNSSSHFEGAVYEGNKDFYVAAHQKEGEQYRIFHQASTGFTLTSVLRKSATKRANAFCRSMDENTEMYTLSEHTASPPYILGNFPRIEIIFVCSTSEKPKANSQPSTDKYENLLKIKDLHEKGILSDKEYQEEKRKILSLT